MSTQVNPGSGDSAGAITYAPITPSTFAITSETVAETLYPPNAITYTSTTTPTFNIVDIEAGAVSPVSSTQREYVRHQLERRMASWVPSSPRRHAEIYAERYREQLTRLKVFGRDVAVAVVTEDHEVLRDLINNRSLWLKKYTDTWRLLEVLQGLNEEYQQCEECGEVHSDCRLTHSYDNVCESCIDSSYRWSECMDEWIRDDETCIYYDTQRAYDRGNGDVCTSGWGDRNAEWSNSEEAYHNEAVYIEGDNDDDDDGEGDGLTSYHGSVRSFCVRSAKPDALYSQTPPLGVELEVYNEARAKVVRYLKHDFDSIGELLLESDSSLDSRYGFEIITDPLGYPEWQDMGPRLCAGLIAQGTKGYNAPHGNNSYGIHITLDRCYLSPLQEARLMLFMASTENQNFMRMIAQRASIYSAAIDIGMMPPRHQKISHLGGLRAVYGERHKKKLVGAGKYCPINFKSDLAEIRIFQSTLNVNSFMKNLEWVWAMVEWVRDSTGSAWLHTDFVAWLGRRGGARADYKHLYDYLLRPSYGVRHLDTRVTNTWAHLLTVPNPVKGVEVVKPTCADDALIAA